jgi:hypothetical protein
MGAGSKVFFSRNKQIAIPSSHGVVRMGEDLVELTNERRQFHAKPFNKQIWYNSLVMGLYDIETNGVDMQEVAKKGVLATIVDRGAALLSKAITSSNAKAKFAYDDEPDDENEQEEPVVQATRGRKRKTAEPPSEEPIEEARPHEAERTWQTLAIPDNFVKRMSRESAAARR